MTTGTPSAAKRGRNPKFPFVPVVIFCKGTGDERQHQITGFAFETRAKAVEFAGKWLAKREAVSAAFQARRKGEA